MSLLSTSEAQAHLTALQARIAERKSTAGASKPNGVSREKLLDQLLPTTDPRRVMFEDYKAGRLSLSDVLDKQGVVGDKRQRIIDAITKKGEATKQLTAPTTPQTSDVVGTAHLQAQVTALDATSQLVSNQVRALTDGLALLSKDVATVLDCLESNTALLVNVSKQLSFYTDDAAAKPEADAKEETATTPTNGTHAA